MVGGNRINKKTMIQKLIKEFPVSTVTNSNQQVEPSIQRKKLIY